MCRISLWQGSRFRFLYDRAVTLRELADYPLIFLEKNSNTRNYVENFFLSKGIQLTPEIELGSHDLVLEFARINLGIACVTQEFSRQYLTDDTLHKIDVTDPIPKRGIGICKLKGVSVSAAGNAFLKLMQQGASVFSAFLKNPAKQLLKNKSGNRHKHCSAVSMQAVLI